MSLAVTNTFLRHWPLWSLVITLVLSAYMGKLAATKFSQDSTITGMGMNTSWPDSCLRITQCACGDL